MHNAFSIESYILLSSWQLQLSYDDYDGTLNIHVIQARGLRAKDKNGFSDPFVKVYLLPGRMWVIGTHFSVELIHQYFSWFLRADNKRRTKSIARTLDPEWHQTLVFMKISRDELHSKTMEVTVWDYDRFKPNDFLGEVLIDLSGKESMSTWDSHSFTVAQYFLAGLSDNTYLDNKPHWYRLHPHEKGHSSVAPKPRTLSPPNSSSSSASHRSRGQTSRERGQTRSSGSREQTSSSHGSRGRSSQQQQGSRERSSSNQRRRDNSGTRDGRNHERPRSEHSRDRDRDRDRERERDRERSREHRGHPPRESGQGSQPDPRSQRRTRSRDPSPAHHASATPNLRPVRHS